MWHSRRQVQDILGDEVVRLLVVTALVVLLPFLVLAQGLTIKDSFPNGRPELRWASFPYFNRDNLEGARDSKAPV
jgi:hypothetical protein